MVYGPNLINSSVTDLLKTHHWVNIEIYILDNERRYLFDISQSLVSGSVDIDVDSDCSRSGNVTILDPQQRLSIDFNGQGWGSNMTNRTIQIIYTVTAMDRSFSYRCPIFTGPIVYASRDGVMLSIDFKGFEFLMQGGVLSDYTWPIGWNRAAIIQNAASISGLPYTNVMEYGGIMYSPWMVQSGDNLWERMKELADSGALNIYFDGNGVLQIKPKAINVNPVMTLDTNWLTEEPDFNLDISKIRNVVRVEGAKIPGTDTTMTYEVWAPPTNPFSPQAMARFGQPRVLPHLIKDDNLNQWTDVISAAWNNLNWDLLVAESTSAVIPVVPFLEEYDVLEIRHPKCWTISPLQKATIPLVGDAEMSIGMLTSTSAGSTTGGKIVSNKGLNGERLLHHGPSGAFNTLRGPKFTGGKSGNKGANWYTGSDGGKGAPNKGKKKKNRDKGKGKGKK